MMPLSLRRKLKWFPEVNIRETQYKFITNSYGVSEFMIRIKTCIPIKANISVLTSLYLKQMQSFITQYPYYSPSWVWPYLNLQGLLIRMHCNIICQPSGSLYVRTKQSSQALVLGWLTTQENFCLLWKAKYFWTFWQNMEDGKIMGDEISKIKLHFIGLVLSFLSIL